MLGRFAAAGFLIVAATATCVAAVTLLLIDGHRPSPIPGWKGHDPGPGKPQTILLLGSDQRYRDTRNGTPGRSDTIMLVRLDPDRHATAVMSIPRDLKVDIPTRQGKVTDKINAAYTLGGPPETVRTVRRLLGIPIHHVVNVNFAGFRRLVNRLGCFYQDVDRAYFNDNAPPTASPAPYATIDVKAGYQLLCGQDTLDWARFRHLDDDVVRSARQQEVVRAAKDQVTTSSLLEDRQALLEVIGRHTQSDLQSAAATIRLLKLGYAASRQPLREVAFPSSPTPEGTFLVTTPADVRRAVRAFLAPSRPARQRRTPAARPTRTPSGAAPDTVVDRIGGENATLDLAVRAGFPVYYPKRRLARGGYVAGTRAYVLRTRTGAPHRAYRIVLAQGDIGQYYGVQGTTWRTPPLLDAPHDTRRVRGRTYQVYTDAGRIRMVAWRTPTAAYWVSNTLSQRLTNAQMLGIATSLTRVGM